MMVCTQILRFPWLAVVLTIGCSAWRATNESTFKLPVSRMSADSVSVDLTFVRLPNDEEHVKQAIWAEADELIIKADRRVVLNQNGIRVGTVGQQMPTALRQLLDDSDSGIQISDASETELLTRVHRKRWNSGQRVPIAATAIREDIVLLQTSKNEPGISGGSFANAQGFIAARAYPQPDGTVRMELTPEIHHGQVRQQWVSGEGTWQLHTGKERKVLSELTTEVTLAPGQVLIVGCTGEKKGIGETFFTHAATGDPQEKLLLVQIIQTQEDELFDSLTADLDRETDDE